MQGKISVIVPVYNVEDYLQFCIDSIRNQTYSNLEIILVNDGSTDSSGNMCDVFAQIDSRIKVIHKKNGGAADARNTGLDNATGDYISIIDGDDYIFPAMYETLQSAIERNAAQFACCSYELVQTQVIEETKTALYEERVLNQKEVYERLFDFHTMWVIQPNKLYCRELFAKYRFPTGYYYEDEYAAHRLLKDVKKAVYVDYPFYRYFIRMGSATRRGITARQFYLLDALEDRIKYFLEEEEFGILPRAEECLYQAYISVTVGIENENRKSRQQQKRITDEYRKLLHDYQEYFHLNYKQKMKRRLYLRAPRLTAAVLRIKNYRKEK